MNIEDLLEMLDDTIDDAFTVPLTGKRMVDADKLRDIIDDIRVNMPPEINQAKAIVRDRAEIISSANQEADNVMRKAEARARVIMSEQEIIKTANKRANEILTTAQKHAKEMRMSVVNYCDSLLKKTEEVYTKDLNDIKKLRSSLRAGYKPTKSADYLSSLPDE